MLYITALLIYLLNSSELVEIGNWEGQEILIESTDYNIILEHIKNIPPFNNGCKLYHFPSIVKIGNDFLKYNDVEMR